MTSEAVTGEAWMRYALSRIRTLVDQPREDMSEDEFSIFTFAQNALAGGEPVIRSIERGPGVRLCRICLAEWNDAVPVDHVHGCPLSTAP
ncbi:hypothetical protein D0Z08_21465 [Nocardioides immobilis]|uniref:Uncharacterized protein n=1 Tax=Nocardioides immobilis TaxID=2049295 RepID=A0A417XXA9_9ACTN|nr:hypothetical protein [Nocardioides immobilis]RHW25013.1 hypothetical protein D0Z08_21465 [Nocardioides immobilis]